MFYIVVHVMRSCADFICFQSNVLYTKPVTFIDWFATFIFLSNRILFGLFLLQVSISLCLKLLSILFGSKFFISFCLKLFFCMV